MKLYPGTKNLEIVEERTISRDEAEALGFPVAEESERLEVVLTVVTHRISGEDATMYVYVLDGEGLGDGMMPGRPESWSGLGVEFVA